MPQLNESYWTERYNSCQTGWDAGSITTPIKTYMDGVKDKSLRILIPGCGFGHEAVYLFEQGFSHITLVDLSDKPLQDLKNRLPDFPSERLIQGDFFDLAGQFDLIIEQTFFCAISPSLRPAYARKAADLLAPGGYLMGVLFNCAFPQEGPPFGGDKEEYLPYFTPYFEVRHFDLCYNSIAPRQGNELFVLLQKSITTKE
jgi:methyl halide transferase